MLRSPLFQLALTLLAFAGLGVHLWNLTYGRELPAPAAAASLAATPCPKNSKVAVVSLYFVQAPLEVELSWGGQHKLVSGAQLLEPFELQGVEPEHGLELSVSARWPETAAARQSLGVELGVEGHMPQLKSLWSSQHEMADVLQFEFSADNE